MEAQGIPQEEGHGSFPHVENAVMEIPTEYPGGEAKFKVKLWEWGVGFSGWGMRKPSFLRRA